MTVRVEFRNGGQHPIKGVGDLESTYDILEKDAEDPRENQESFQDVCPCSARGERNGKGRLRKGQIKKQALI